MVTFDPTFDREAEDPYGFYEDKAAVAVAVRAGKVLLIRRRTAKAGPLWSLPISKIEPDESPEAAAVRGTFETTGVTVTTRFVFSRLAGPAPSYIACDFVTETINLLRLVAPDNPQAYPDNLADPEEVTKVEWCDGGQLAERVRDGIPEDVKHYLDSVLER
jgi:ADP-ribose pyrophosphatase YjhB (NUDIX family)